MVNLVRTTYKAKPFTFTKHVSQGSIPDRIWKNDELQEYVKDHPYGYVGNLGRRKITDRAVMKYFKDAKKSDKFIIRNFLKDARGRYMADSFYKKTENQIYKAMEREFVSKEDKVAKYLIK